MKSLKFISLLAGLLATAGLARAQELAPATFGNVIFNGTVVSATGTAAPTGTITSLFAPNGVDYTLQGNGSLSDPVPYAYTKSGSTTARIAENASGALPSASVNLTFTGLTAGSFVATYNGTSTQTGTFTLTPVGAGSPLTNVSTLTTITAGGSAITGFVISGTGPRRILIRAVGPGLTAFGVASALPNPSIILWRGTQQVATNDDWNSGANVDASLPAVFGQVGAFGLTSGSKDSALVVTLNPGVYSAQIFGGTASESGVVLMEVYLVE